MGHFLHCFWIESWCLEHFCCTSRIAFPSPTEKLGKTWAQRAWEPFLLGFMFIINLLAYFPCCLKKKKIHFLTRLICCLVSEEKNSQMRSKKETRSSNWLFTGVRFVPYETYMAFLPAFPLCSLLLCWLLCSSLMLLNVLPSVPLLRVQGVLPELHYIKASMLHAWQPTLHFSYVITTLLPWNWSILALWQLPLQLCVHQLIKSLFSWLPKQSLFPSDTRIIY